MPVMSGYLAVSVKLSHFTSPPCFDRRRGTDCWRRRPSSQSKQISFGYDLTSGRASPDRTSQKASPSDSNLHLVSACRPGFTLYMPIESIGLQELKPQKKSCAHISKAIILTLNPDAFSGVGRDSTSDSGIIPIYVSFYHLNISPHFLSVFLYPFLHSQKAQCFRQAVYD